MLLLTLPPALLTQVAVRGGQASKAQHKKGCNCRKSHCLKKYCECFQMGVRCGDLCKCQECKNYEPDRPDREDAQAGARSGARQG